MYDAGASIVIYKNNKQQLLQTIKSVLNTRLRIKLILVDNSPTNSLKSVKLDSRIEYIFNPSNPGFGASHNIAINKSIERGLSYHFVVNPDVFFHDDIISLMLNYANSDSRIGMLMPKILNLNGSIQHLPKLLPSPFSLLMRKLKWPSWYHKKLIEVYELRFVDKNKSFNSPVISGCFTLLNLSAIKEIGSYDNNFFMYFEDWDLSRRIHKKYKTIYFPEASLYHHYNSGANKRFKLFLVFIKSAITYFNKWGWFFDSERKQINKCTLESLKNENFNNRI